MPVSTDRAARLRSIAVDEAVSLVRTIGEAEVALFLAISADTHPVHIDRTAARRMAIPWRAVPAAYGVGLVAAAMGVLAGRVPPPGAVSYRYRLNAEGWWIAGDTVTTVLTVRAVRPERYEVECAAVCRNERGDTLLSGTTVMKVL